MTEYRDVFEDPSLTFTARRGSLPATEGTWRCRSCGCGTRDERCPNCSRAPPPPQPTSCFEWLPQLQLPSWNRRARSYQRFMELPEEVQEMRRFEDI